MEILNKPLNQIRKELRAQLISTLENATALADIKRIVYGEKIRIGTLLTPAIWIIPEPYTPEVTGGQTANHDIRFIFAVLVKDTDPEQGLQTAEDLALTIYDTFMADRTLAGKVWDIVPQQIDPAYDLAGAQIQLSYAAATFDFRIKRREK